MMSFLKLMMRILGADLTTWDKQDPYRIASYARTTR